MMRVAFLGLGTMGSRMACHLLKKRLPVTVWNRTSKRAEPLVTSGASLADSPRRAVAEADLVLHCLGSAHAIEQVVFGPEGFAPALRPGQIVVDMATSAPALSRRQAERVRRQGAEFLDAPVFGSREEAESASLCVVVGGQRESFELARPVLECFASSVHHLGGTGAGATMGLVGSLIVCLQLEALGEALCLARRADLDLARVVEIIGQTDFRSPLLLRMGRDVSADSFSPVFALRHLAKDADQIAARARELGVSLPALEVIRGHITAAMAGGRGGDNASVLAKWLLERS